MTAGRMMVTLALVATMAAVTACGRRGDPLTPYDAAVQARKDAEKAKQPLPPEPQKPDRNKPFILDRLIQ
ncbi:hypothetical protein [Mesorhizobium sp. SP-1A]|jgi:predicted small lipoprotein YifL|uniref:hypothetical protein n=1 Tax=Mesorhizobium sp. SP-1A TaxID=3077840 RepID=UPI0028F71851|nr:hypothetical protein [Mesorhizobium sp. SP-1A]